MADRRWWIRVLMLVLSVQLLVTGLWAVVDPLGWYNGFPGLGRHWVPANGPYDQHLVIDAGSGFLAVGVLLLIAIVWAKRGVIQVALVAFIIQDVPHFLFHAMHPAKSLSSTDNTLSIGGLAFTVVIAVVCLIAVSRGTGQTVASPSRAETVTT